MPSCAWTGRLYADVYANESSLSFRRTYSEKLRMTLSRWRRPSSACVNAGRHGNLASATDTDRTRNVYIIRALDGPVVLTR